MTRCQTREELIAEYESVYMGRKIPDDLSPMMREQFNEELAVIEHTDDFKFIVQYPSWLPEEAKIEFKPKFQAMLDSEILAIVDDYRAKYKPGCQQPAAMTNEAVKA